MGSAGCALVRAGTTQKRAQARFRERRALSPRRTHMACIPVPATCAMAISGQESSPRPTILTPLNSHPRTDATPPSLVHLFPRPQGGWRPVALARFALEASAYRPIASVPRVPCPVLFLSATRDALCPHDLVRRAAGLLPGETSGGAGNGNGSGSSRLVEFESSHFDIYHGEHGARAGREMVEFIRKHTGRA